MTTILDDLRHTLRACRRSPGFPAAIVLVTALGVGATTATFTLTDYVLLRTLPFPESGRLVKILQGAAARPTSLRGLRGTNQISPALYLGWRAGSTSFVAMGAYGFVSSNLSGGGEPERLDGAVVTASTLELLGMPPALGRTLTEADDSNGAACSILISDGLWRRRFGGAASTVGTKIRLDEEFCEVVGVMPRQFSFPSRSTMFWKPARFAPDAADNIGDQFLWGIARLKPGTSFDQARAEMTGVTVAMLKRFPAENRDVSPVLLHLRDEINDQSRTLLWAMAGAAGCLLLITCTNLASLTVARATARARELAVRTALGASRRRLLRQLFTEGLVLAVAGGVLGIVIAIEAIPVAARLVPTALPIAEVPGVDVRMLVIAAIATLGTGIGFSLLPAFRAARRAAGGDLRESSRTGASRATSRARDTLVVVQVAASIVLLVGTGLLVRALARVQSTPAGFSGEHVITARTFLPWSKYGSQASRVEFYRKVLDDVRALPGVTAAAYTSYLPMTMRGGIWGVKIPGRILPAGRSDNASSRFVTPEYFRAMDVPLLTGRAFDESDSAQAQPVAIVSQSFARSYLEGQEPLGRTFEFGPAGERTIVGIVGDVRVRGLETRSEPQVYLSYQQQGDNRTMGYVPKDLVVRVRADRDAAAAMDALIPSIRRIIWSADPDQPISDVQPLSAIVEGETVSRVVQVRVLGLFAAVSCLLAGVGLYGLLAFVVSTRTREFGVRLALGAQRGQILALVGWRGLKLGGAGMAAGVAIAYLAGRGIESVLAGISPADPVTLGAAVAFAIAMTLAGSLLPATRAARTHPKEAMQSD
jgi:predicted permease